MSESGRISPTAHYTGYVWARNGLSHPELQTLEGRLLFESLQPTMLVSRALGGPSLERYLLARHRAIDTLLERAIEEHRVTQLIEVACGFSPRGWRFAKRYGSKITYVEADLPDVAARKRRALERAGSLSEHHRVETVDVLRDSGDGSIAAVAGSLDRRRGIAIVTEGLLGYLDADAVAGVWRRFADTMHGFPSGRYIADVHLGIVHRGSVQTIPVQAFRLMLSAFVRGRVHLHFEDPEDAIAGLRAAGFDGAEVFPATSFADGDLGFGGRLAHILEASTVRSK
jgi:O-methyltransferase involved in polyketide biosynthesis